MSRRNSSLTDHRFVFIGGLHRSGTTIFHDLLARHPEISGLTETGVPMNEGQFLQDVFPPEGRYRKLWPIRHLRRIGLQRLAEKGYGGPGRFAFDAGAHLTEASPLARPDIAERLYQAWQPYWNENARYLTEKSPPNLIRMRFLQALFPNSYFITIYRHPVAVSLATQRNWRRRTTLYSLFRHWLHANDLFRRDQRYLRRVITIRYEDFVAKPTDTLTEVYRFLGLPPQDRREESELDPQVNTKYLIKWQALDHSPGGRAYRRLMVQRFEPAFQEYGYSLEE